MFETEYMADSYVSLGGGSHEHGSFSRKLSLPWKTELFKNVLPVSAEGKNFYFFFKETLHARLRRNTLLVRYLEERHFVCFLVVNLINQSPVTRTVTQPSCACYHVSSRL